ncbi:MAG: hypothetical protein JO108_35385 [Acidobacteriaceae bacterium]|nr:hypothetical protein [Acidobacteriaceae bacterium]
MATTPQRRQSTRRMAYSRKTKNPHKGMNSKAPFGELVVSGRWQMAARADCGRTFAGPHNHFDALLVGTETGVLIDKTSETMAAVQDRGQFHDGETSTIDRHQTAGFTIGKPRPPSKICRPEGWIRTISGTKVRNAYTLM